MLSVSLDYKQAAGCLNSPSCVRVSERAFVQPLLFWKRDTIFGSATFRRIRFQCIHSRSIIKPNAHREGGFSRSSRHLAWLFSALQLILSKCKLDKNVPNGFRARLNFGLVKDLNEFYSNVGGIIGKHSETIVITFQPVTFIIIIPLFRHANFWLLLTTVAVETPHSMQQVFSLFVFSSPSSAHVLMFSSALLGVSCLICSVLTGNAHVVHARHSEVAQ